jgi:hypothetical protein
LSITFSTISLHILPNISTKPTLIALFTPKYDSNFHYKIFTVLDMKRHGFHLTSGFFCVQKGRKIGNSLTGVVWHLVFYTRQVCPKYFLALSSSIFDDISKTADLDVIFWHPSGRFCFLYVCVYVFLICFLFLCMFYVFYSMHI